MKVRRAMFLQARNHNLEKMAYPVEKFQSIRSATKVCVESRHQYGISALVYSDVVLRGLNGDLVQRRLLSQATYPEALGRL